MNSGTIIVLAGGTSVYDIDVTKLQNFGYVIGVNDAAVHAPVDIALSMDRLWFENRWNVIPESIPLYMRRSAIKGLHNRKNLELYDCNHEIAIMSDQHGILNGTNSGMVAINLAYQLKPKELYLVGFDMHRNEKGEAYWYPPYPWTDKPKGATGDKRYLEWSMQFSAIQYQMFSSRIKVYNVGITSMIPKLPKITTKYFMELVNAAS